jgi:maltose alpha-D-glucosyltransferase/alpha-amylase
MILKLFRRLQPGENPDVEIGRFLTEIAHFDRVPPFFGDISMASTGGEKTTIAMLQGLVANNGDGWDWFRQELQHLFAGQAVTSDPPEIPSASFVNHDGGKKYLATITGPTLEAAALLGNRVAELHLALSSWHERPEFEPEPMSHTDLEEDGEQIEAQIRSALETLRSKIPTLYDSTADAAALILARRSELLKRGRSIEDLPAAGQRIRIHGDFHLGQTLRIGPNVKDEAVHVSGGDFVFLDFEGEPARPLSKRRRKQSPLKDVAGIMRSFSYVAFAALKQYNEDHAQGGEAVESPASRRWAEAWQNSASQEFLNAYLERIAANPGLLPPASEAQRLLNAYVLEKALYELQYELNNRPGWVQIPIAGILSFL